MKKLLIFLGGYLPASGYGGPVTSVSNLTAHLGGDYEIRIVASDHDFRKTERLGGIEPGWNRVGAALVRYLPEAEFTRARFGQIMDEVLPDAVYLSSIFHDRMNRPALQAAAEREIPVILAPRGELDPGALRRGMWKKTVYYRSLRALGVYRKIYFHATCESEAEAVCRLLKADPARVFLLPNLPAPHREKTSLDKRVGRLRIMICSRILPNKNQLTAIEAVCRLPFPAECDIFGPVEDAAYWERCRQAMDSAPEQIRFRFGGAIPADRVSEELLRHDCFLLPTAFENYGHSISEALLHDCPVIISRGTTPWDGVREAGCGWTVPPEEPEGYVRALTELGGMDSAAYAALIERLREFCRETIRSEELKRGYRRMFDRVIKERNR